LLERVNIPGKVILSTAANRKAKFTLREGKTKLPKHNNRTKAGHTNSETKTDRQEIKAEKAYTHRGIEDRSGRTKGTQGSRANYVVHSLKQRTLHLEKETAGKFRRTRIKSKKKRRLQDETELR